jgi:DNA gyrase subunit B
MDFSCGVPTSELRQTGTSKRAAPKVHFLPDKTIFTATEFNYDTLAQRLREMAFLNKGLEITLTDERTADPRPAKPSRASSSTPAASPSSSSTSIAASRCCTTSPS